MRWQSLRLSDAWLTVSRNQYLAVMLDTQLDRIEQFSATILYGHTETYANIASEKRPLLGISVER